MDEILWRFNFQNHLSESEINSFYDEFVEQFVEPRGWSCGGATQMGMYDAKGDTDASVLRSELLLFLKTKTRIIHSITFLDYDEASDDFVDREVFILSTEGETN